VDLPAGLSTRALTLADVPQVAALAAAEDLVDCGEVMIDEADIAGEWRQPSFDTATDTLGVFDDDRLIAYAQANGERAETAVHPDHRSRGIGTELARWTRAAARDHGARVVGAPVATGSAGERLLHALGYRPRWTSWLFRLPEGHEVSAQPVPPGYALRAATPDELRAVWTVIEDAFAEWDGRERHDFPDFSALVYERAGFEPWNMRVATDPGGAVVGAAHVILKGTCAYVARLAIAPAHRSRGLYEKVGMVVTHEWHNYAIEL
jgi:GNAT superfamily N-acetyltransferase